jgi:hypothetical protein
MRIVHHLGLILIAAGLLALVGYSARGFFFASDISLGIRAFTAVAVFGFLLLVGYVGWDRYLSARKEPKEIKEADK